MLTLEKLEEFEVGFIFASGVSLEPLLFADAHIQWLAVKGQGGTEWTIKYHLAALGLENAAKRGFRCFPEAIIKRLVPCTNEAFRAYLY